MSDIFNLQGRNRSDRFNLTKRGGLRNGFNNFIYKHPTWMVYIRVDKKFEKINGREGSTGSPNLVDKNSFGTGNAIQFEKHSVRKVVRPRDLDSPMFGPGYLSEFRIVIYTPRYYYPESKDFYFDVEWDTEIDGIEKYGKPINIINCYQVDEVSSFKEDEVTYFACQCVPFNFTLQQQNEWLVGIQQTWTAKKVV